MWDVIGRGDVSMGLGDDRPGRIVNQPGGVALNIAVALRRFGLAPILLGAVGRDAEGTALIEVCAALGLETAHVLRPADLPTDRYIAIEAAGQLIAAMADAHTLEAAGAAILAPLRDGPLGTRDAPYRGPVALDGNLTGSLLAEIAQSPDLAEADLRVAPASPGKVMRLRPFLGHGAAMLYLNLEEASLLCEAHFDSAPEAAATLVARGARRVMVTHGSGPACDGDARALVIGQPPAITVRHVTGAGDRFMAAHIAAELAGADREGALNRALIAAARHVSGDLT